MSLLKDGDRVVGAFGYDRERVDVSVFFKSKAVVVCTGGLGRAYAVTSAIPGKARATAFPLAYHAGAELLDMEFIQFHPTGNASGRRASKAF